MRPEAYFGMGKPTAPWSNRDRVLASGLVFYEQSLNSLGIPSWIAQDGNRRFEVDELMDHAAQLAETTQREYQKNENADTAGLRIVVQDLGPRPTSPSR